MCFRLENHIQKVLAEIDGNDAEKADLKEELLCHLRSAKEQLVANGHNDHDAEKKAIQQFGAAEMVGNAVQEALYPRRRLFFFLLAIVSLVTTFATYLMHLFLEGDAYFGWLIAAGISSSILLLLTAQQLSKIERKSILIAALIVHGFVFLYGYLIAGTLFHWLSIVLAVLFIAIISFTIFLIYRISLYKQDTYIPQLKWLHFSNITLGLFYIGISLFFFWAVLLFMEEFQPFIFIGIIPIIIWLLLYIIQFQLMKRDKHIFSYSLFIISCCLIIGMIWLFFVR